MLDGEMAARLAGRDCPHIAALIQSFEDLPGVLASFYALGAARNGWLVQGSLPGMVEDDRRMLIAAGVDVQGLEAAGQLSIVELDLTLAPELWVDGWSGVLMEQLRAGFEAVWFSRFPIGPSDEEIAAVLPFEQAWMSRFRGRPMVTLCPYILGGSRAPLPRMADVARVHDHVVTHAFPADGGRIDAISA